MNIDYNTSCYRFEKREYTKGLLDNCVDATYIIHLENNGREDHIEKQLSEYNPSKTVYIAHNKGFKKCPKKLINQASYQDLTDAFLQCFKHARENHYGNILILEDDFIFSPEIKEQKHIDRVCSFIGSKKEEEFIYYLGCIPVVIYPNSMCHYTSLKSFCYHSVIYSQKTIQKSLNTEYKHWDVIIENNIKNKYLYCKPLCYQTFPETENKKSWSEKDGNQIVSALKSSVIKTLGMDKKAEPGFSILYWVSFILWLFFLIIVVFLLFRIFSSNTIISMFTVLKKRSSMRKK